MSRRLRHGVSGFAVKSEAAIAPFTAGTNVENLAS